MNDNQIDIVMPWVDGGDPLHSAKRQQYSGIPEGYADKKFAAYERALDVRWQQHNEINFSLRTIGSFAPRVRKVFIVADNQEPDLSGLSIEFLDKISIVDHATIFRGYEHVLPTFNSATIGTAFWRIEGLADQFIIFNDDCFLTKPVTREQFFRDGNAILRGSYERFDRRFDENEGWYHHLRNGALAAGITGDEFLHLAHVCQPLRRDLIADYFADNPDVFERNIAFRFRDKTQFSMVALGAHLSLKHEVAEMRRPGSTQDWAHISYGFLHKRTPYWVHKSLMSLSDENCYLACINDFGECMRKVPRTQEHLNNLLQRSWQDDV